VPLIGGYDDLGLVNPVGAVRGTRSEACFYGALASLPTDMRFSHKYMAILYCCDEKVLKSRDPVRVVAGADPLTGDILETDRISPGAQHRAGLKGRLVTVLACSRIHPRFNPQVEPRFNFQNRHLNQAHIEPRTNPKSTLELIACSFPLGTT
jgi:hypothetical protein